jgi:hypothetical protein
MLGVFLFGLYLIVVSVIFFSTYKKWWIKVETQSPACIYYFGPFDSAQEALSHQDDYLHDLREEGAQGISAIVEKARPKQLTIFEEEETATP